MQIKKNRELTFLGYFGLLLILGISGMKIDINVINIIYLIVIISCSLKFFLLIQNVEK